VVLLNRTHRLPDGTSVRLRLPHVRDRTGLQALFGRLGLGLTDLDAGLLLRRDPRHDVVLCALVWTGGGDVLGGYAASGAQGDTVLADEELAPGLGALVAACLEQRASRRHVA